MTGDKGICALDAWAYLSAFGSCSAATSDATSPSDACAAVKMDGVEVCTYVSPLTYDLKTNSFLGMSNSEAAAKVEMRT